MHEELENFYFSKEEPIRGCLLSLRQIILEQDPLISETRKYGMPCFCYKNKMFCYLWTDKKSNEPYILMVEGKLLNHPSLVQGSRARMKTLPITASKDLPIQTILEVLQEGIQLYKSGTVKIK